MLKVISINNWTTPYLYMNSSSYGSNISAAIDYLQYSGDFPILFFIDKSFGVSYQYLTATSSYSDISQGGSDYTNASALPRHGSLELVMLQSYQPPYSPDPTFTAMSSGPSVVSSFSPITNATCIGYALKCALTSSVGTALLSAPHRTYTYFSPSPALAASPSDPGNLGLTASYPGIVALGSLVFAAFTAVSIDFQGPPVCMPGGPVEIEQAVTCNPC